MIMIRRTDGLCSAPQADPKAPDGVVWKPARYSVGLVDPEREPEDGLDLLTEFLTDAPVTPWACSEDRETALRFLPTASWVAPGIRERLVAHVHSMPWFEDREELPKGPKRKRKAPGPSFAIQIVSGHGCMLYNLPDSEARSGHVWLPARWSPGNWDEAPGGILDEMQRGAGAVPWLSNRHRQERLDRLRNDQWSLRSLGPEIIRRLIRHVEETPYWLGDEHEDYLRNLTGPDALD